MKCPDFHNTVSGMQQDAVFPGKIAQKMKTVPKEKALFGPIRSRRLGRSLGIDLLPFKTCSLDCIYCECGRTSRLVTERKEYYPLNAVFQELDAFFQSGAVVDYITFSGVGEPTLHTGIGQIVSYIKEKRPSQKVCLLTNGTELDHQSLQDSLHQLDLIVPSLDASCEKEFQQINRPADGVTFEQLVNAILLFRKNVPEPEMLLEFFVVPGVNDSGDAIARFRQILRQIRPDRIQLNTMDRPGTESHIQVPPREHLEMIAGKLADLAPVDIIARQYSGAPANPVYDSVDTINAKIEALLKQGICDPEILTGALNLREGQAAEYLRRLERSGRRGTGQEHAAEPAGKKA